MAMRRMGGYRQEPPWQDPPAPTPPNINYGGASTGVSQNIINFANRPKRNYTTPTYKPKTSTSKPKVTSYKPPKTPTKTATAKAPTVQPGPVKPIVPTLDQYLGGDTTYLDQLRQFDRTLGDFIANLGVRKTRLTADYGENKRDMEQQRIKDLEAIKNDFASRGLLSSGLLVDESGKYEKDYANQLADFERQFTQSQSDLTLEDTQFRREQELAKEAARQDAARRRAEKYGL